MFLIIILICSYSSLSAQKRALQASIDSLKFITWMGYGCEPREGQSEDVCGNMKPFWNVVKLKKPIIPYLIEILDDSTTLEVAVPYMGYNYTIADIALEAMQHIIDGIPTWKLLGVAFDEHGCGGCTHWRHLNEDHSHRKKFKAAVKAWYDANKNRLKWIKGDKPDEGIYIIE